MPPTSPVPVSAIAIKFRPWRSIFLARVVTVAALIVGIPLFLRMPPWCDLTLYDLAARNILTGGVHYRDVFDTNLPGFVWALAVVRATLGWGVEAVRAVDILVVAGVVFLLDRLAARSGAPPWCRAWAVAGAAVFYPFTSEVNHCQRDVWMTLPVLAAILLRVRRLSSDRLPTFRPAAIEGLLWGLAVWVKPHVVIPAAAILIATAPRIRALGGRRTVGVDLLGNLFGGLIVGAIGIGYLVRSGTWPAFVEVFTFWNTGYAGRMFAELPRRLGLQLSYFPPWSYLQLISVPAAIGIVADARSRKAGVAALDSVQFARMVLAVLYLAWTTQGLLFQREFHYVHVPETLMLLPVLATKRWAAGAFGIGWLALAGLVVLAGIPADNPPTGWPDTQPRPRVALRHPALDPARMRLWCDCWRTGLAKVEYRRRMNALRMVNGFHPANDWEQLGEVADWLAARGVDDHEVMGWDDAPHAVCLELGVKPGFRFQHVYQMMCVGSAQEAAIRRELCGAAGHVRYVVSDLEHLEMLGEESSGDVETAGPDLYPLGMSAKVRSEFPYQQPAVFRSGNGRGRYIVHELRHRIPGCVD